MDKRISQGKSVASGGDLNDNRVGIWGILALILIVFGFIVAPLMPGLFDTTDSSNVKFGSYKGQPIYYAKDNKFAQYVNSYSNFYSKLRRDNSYDIDYFIWRLAFMKYVEDIAFLDLAKSNNFYISKNVLNKNLMSSLVYLDSNGNFSPKRYNKVSDYQKFKIHSEAVENLLSSNIQVFLNSGFVFSDFLLSNIKDMSKVQKKIAYVTLSYEDFPQDELISYVKNNQKLFKSLDVVSISFKNLNDANDAYDKLSKGTPFEEVAKFYSEDVANFKGIASSKQYYFDLDLVLEKKEDLATIFSLKVNEFTIPIKSKSSSEYKIYKVLSDVHDFDQNSNHDISSVKNYIETYEPSVIETFLEQKLNTILEEVNSAVGEEQSLKKYNLALKEDMVNLAYNMNIYPSTLKELSVFSNSKDFYDLIFDLKEGQWSKPFLANHKVYSFSLRSTFNDSHESNDLIQGDHVLDSFYQANNKLVLDNILNKDNFKENFNEAFFSLQNISLNAGN
ncbi:peptidylprolyl isomerase [Borrelia persica]|uniref:peptidylprolyl isomerase n=1 Tax=Borrelia persica TaxID=44448 RepID=UPI000466EB48|nr:peptidylprolyl isomerase [Borrelia persica]